MNRCVRSGWIFRTTVCKQAKCAWFPTTTFRPIAWYRRSVAVKQRARGTVVNLELSKGPPSVVRVPRFVRLLSIGSARALATRDKIHLGQIVWTPFGPYGPPHGEVVRQIPGPDSRIDAFDRRFIAGQRGAARSPGI